LISGIATAVKSLRPQATVLGVEPELAADAQQSLRSGEHTAWDPDDTYRTLADGLRTPALGAHPWQHVRRYVDDIITVSEDGIRSRSEERRVGKECRSRWSPAEYKKKETR